MRPADHHQALAEIADVDLEGGHLAIGQRRTGHVDEDDRVVRGQRQRIRREPGRRDRVDVLALRLERADQLGGDRLVAGDDEDPRFSLDDRVGVGPIVLAERVLGGLDHGAEADEARLLRLDEELDLVRAGPEIGALDPDLDPVGEQPDGRRLGDRRVDVGDDLDLLAEPRRRRGRQALDDDFLGRPQPDHLGLDLDPASGGQGRLRLALAGRIVAVGEQDDPLLGVVGEECRRQPERGPDVRGRADRRRRDPVELANLGRQALDERAPPERHDPRRVALRHECQALADEGERVLAARLADRIREIDDEDGGQPIDGQDETEPGKGEHEREEKESADDQGDATAGLPGASTGGSVKGVRQAQGGNEQEERERGVEGDAHVRHCPWRTAWPGP